MITDEKRDSYSEKDGETKRVRKVRDVERVHCGYPALQRS